MQPNTGELYLPPPNTTSRPVSVGLRRPSRRALVAATAALALSLTACGSRLGQARLEATNNVFKKVVDSQSAAAGPAAAPGGATDTNATTAGGAGTGAAAPGVAVATGGVSSSSGGAATAGAGGTGAGSATASRATGSAGSTSGGATVSGGPAARHQVPGGQADPRHRQHRRRCRRRPLADGLPPARRPRQGPGLGLPADRGQPDRQEEAGDPLLPGGDHLLGADEQLQEAVAP